MAHTSSKCDRLLRPIIQNILQLTYPCLKTGTLFDSSGSFASRLTRIAHIMCCIRSKHRGHNLNLVTALGRIFAPWRSY